MAEAKLETFFADPDSEDEDFDVEVEDYFEEYFFEAVLDDTLGCNDRVCIHEMLFQLLLVVCRCNFYYFARIFQFCYFCSSYNK